MKRKLLSTLLAGAMVASLCVPAFAAPMEDAEALATGQSVTYTSTLQSPVIKVTLSTNTGTIAANPYKMTYTPTGAEEPTNAQIYSPAGFITNESNVAIRVMLNGSVEVGGDATLATKSAASATTKSAYLFAQVVANADAENEPAKWSGTSFVLGSAPKSAATSMLVMPAKDADGNPSYAAFRISGDLASNLPADVSWSTADTFAATLTFTFESEAVGTTK